MPALNRTLAVAGIDVSSRFTLNLKDLYRCLTKEMNERNIKAASVMMLAMSHFVIH
jgi:hypothetical protein